MVFHVDELSDSCPVDLACLILLSSTLCKFLGLIGPPNDLDFVGYFCLFAKMKSLHG
jgi:hypothetical protein